jgi:low temperature requirement protein LtrA
MTTRGNDRATRPPARVRPWQGQLLGARTSDEGDRVTTLELLFDLVYVFAFTQVTYVMSHGDPPLSVVQGLLVLVLLWWSWVAFSWLANQARANVGVVRLAMIVAMAAMFLTALAIPEAYHDLPGGLSGPLVFVTGYLVVRVAHLVAYVVAAQADRRLFVQIVSTVGLAAAPSLVLLYVGALLDEHARTWVWAAAIAYDLAVTYVTAKVGDSWRVNSGEHFAERHGLVVILALGESIVAVGVGVSLEPISAEIIVGSLLAVAITTSLWWSYFVGLAEVAGQALEHLTGPARARAATDAYTFGHLPVVAGTILVALGAEEVMGHLDEEHLGATGAAAVGAGVAAFLVGTALVVRRMTGEWLWWRIAAGLLPLALVPVLADVPPLVALTVPLVLLLAVAVAEASRWRTEPTV